MNDNKNQKNILKNNFFNLQHMQTPHQHLKFIIPTTQIGTINKLEVKNVLMIIKIKMISQT